MTQDYEFPLTANGPPENEDGNPPLWQNPDVPSVDAVINGREEEFFCPYQSCGNDFALKAGDDPEENRDQIINLIDRNDGTLRCDECNEPIYGFYANGDHD